MPRAAKREKVRAQQHGDTFVIYTTYGSKQARRPIGDLKPGTTVTHDGNEYKLYALYEDHAELRADAEPPVDVPLDTRVGIDQDDHDPSDPLGQAWAGRDQPVFALEDLPALIKDLQRIKNNPDPVAPEVPA